MPLPPIRIAPSILSADFGRLAEEVELAMELMAVTNEAEMEQFLGNVFKKAWKGIKTIAKPESRREEIYSFIREQIEAGRQGPGVAFHDIASALSRRLLFPLPSPPGLGKRTRVCGERRRGGVTTRAPNNLASTCS